MSPHRSGGGGRVPELPELSWSRLLAREFCPAELPISDEIARRYAEGGRSRAAVLGNRAGEQAGGFGGGGAAELASLLDAIAAAAPAVLSFLDAHQGLGTLAGCGSLVLSVVEFRLRGRTAPEPSEPLPPGGVALLDDAVEQMAQAFVSRGLDDDAAVLRAYRVIHLFETEGPSGAAAYVRRLSGHDLGPVSARRAGARRGWLARWWRRRASAT